LVLAVAVAVALVLAVAVALVLAVAVALTGGSRGLQAPESIFPKRGFSPGPLLLPLLVLTEARIPLNCHPERSAAQPKDLPHRQPQHTVRTFQPQTSPLLLLLGTPRLVAQRFSLGSPRVS